MTGIERLVDIVNDGPYSGGMIHISAQKLREICEQIEREVDDISGYENDVLTFVEEKGGLDELKKQFEASDRSYNRKTFYDRLALGWIEEHGGLDAVKERLMPDGMEWLLEVWPKLSNGEYCKFGDWWTAKRYGDYEPKKLLRLVIYTPEQLSEWEQGDGESYGYEWDFMRPSEVGYRPDKAADPKIDSWERIEDDATLEASVYCDRRGIDVEEGHSFVEPMARDLVCRCKAVAEKENNNE